MLLFRLPQPQKIHELMKHVTPAELESTSNLFLSQDDLGDQRLFDDGTLRQSVTVNLRTLERFSLEARKDRH